MYTPRGAGSVMPSGEVNRVTAGRERDREGGMVAVMSEEKKS
jgi:hypothetical protein